MCNYSEDLLSKENYSYKLIVMFFWMEEAVFNYTNFN